MKEVSEICKDCNHLDTHTNIDDVSPVCGFHLGLAHWEDAKRVPYCDGDVCRYKGLTDYEANVLYFGGKRK